MLVWLEEDSESEDADFALALSCFFGLPSCTICVHSSPHPLGLDFGVIGSGGVTEGSRGNSPGIDFASGTGFLITLCCSIPSRCGTSSRMLSSLSTGTDDGVLRAK